MNRLFSLASRNTRLWLISFLLVTALVWIFHQIFFSTSHSENISIYSHQKEGNRAFFEYLQERKVSLSTVYQPAYVWVKRIFKNLNQINRVHPASFHYKYIFVEKEGSKFWSESEAKWFRKWIEQGGDMIIFTPTPSLYWEAVMLPIVYENKEEKRKSKRHFDVGFRRSMEKILRSFIFTRRTPSGKGPTQNVSAQKCYFQGETEPFNIVSNDSPYDQSLMYPIQRSGWKKIEECRYGNRSYLWKWRYRRGKITFVYSPNIMNNEMIADADNILFIKKAIDLTAKDHFIWDAYHHGVSQSPNLWYFVFHTLPGRIFIWFFLGFLLYFWYRNQNLRKYPLPRKEKEAQAASLLYFHVLASRFSKKKVVDDAYDTLKKYLSQKEPTPRTNTPAAKTGEAPKTMNTKNKLKFLRQYFSSF